MSHMIKNLGIFLLITAWLTSCGQKPAGNSQANKDLEAKDLEAKEKKLLDELKPLWEDDRAENLAAIELVKGMLTPNTPKYKLNERLALLLTDIQKKEKELKDAEEETNRQFFSTPEADLEQDPFKKGKVLEGLKKEIELLKVRKEKFELALGVDKSA